MPAGLPRQFSLSKSLRRASSPELRQLVSRNRKACWQGTAVASTSVHAAAAAVIDIRDAAAVTIAEMKNLWMKFRQQPLRLVAAFADIFLA